MSLFELITDAILLLFVGVNVWEEEEEEGDGEEEEEEEEEEEAMKLEGSLTATTVECTIVHFLELTRQD